MSRLWSPLRSFRTRLSKTTLDGKIYWSWYALWTVPAAIFVNDSLIEINSINGHSMSPTLSPDFDETGSRDYVAIRKYDTTQNVRRGDIIAFWTPHDPESLGLKRVIATAGDTVYPTESHFAGEVIPYGHVWVEGDNWRKTLDSNDYGPISKALITGKAAYIVWPWRRVGALSTEWHHPRTRVVPGESEIPKVFLE